MDTPETISGRRGRAPVEGVMDSDIPTQSLGKKCRMGDLHLAFVAKWRHLEMEAQIAAQSRQDPGVPFVVGGRGPRYLRGLLKIATALWGGRGRGTR